MKRPNPDWQTWPETFGAPKGDLRQAGTTTLTRRFENGSVVVDCETRTVTSK